MQEAKAKQTNISIKNTRQNNKIAFITLEDSFGEIECIVFSAQYSKYMHILQVDKAVFIEGNVSVADDALPKIILSNMTELMDNSEFSALQKNNMESISRTLPEISKSQPTETKKAPEKIFLRVQNMNCEPYRKALNIVDIFDGNIKVIFYVEETKKYVSYSNGLSLTPFVRNELCMILGDENVVVK